MRRWLIRGRGTVTAAPVELLPRADGRYHLVLISGDTLLQALTDDSASRLLQEIDGMARQMVRAMLGIAVATLAACGGGNQTPNGGLTGPTCSDLFAQGAVRTYKVDIDPAEWQSMDAEFHDLASLQTGNPFAAYHPIVMHLDGETVNASVKLHGQSSWLQTVMFDGDRAKMQFSIAFDKGADPKARFHGEDKLVFDMPRSDWSFLHDRLAHAWLRQAGIMATCAASARLEINGAYYGLYVIEQDTGQSVLRQFFPENAAGDLWKGGQDPETNKLTADYTRQGAFWAATDLTSMSSIVDIPGSLRSWAAEALLNDADGYYGGFHNFLLYDQGGKGMVFLPDDTDSTFDWLAMFDLVGSTDHPVFWWAGRAQPAPTPGPHWVIAMSDAGVRRQYADAMAAVLDQWDAGQVQSWIDAWSQQIAADVVADPHAWATGDDFNAAIQSARQIVQSRADYLRTFVACEQNGTGDDADGDGARWCDDCNDADASVHVGAPELCNGVDDNCNGAVDEGCQ